ncbi:V-set and immunoglobulin domain-containing protein 2 [Bombina bombina]|uniref:V-set and immunoglobulin domain-containing protein 2 n=1 Tax=Bombina bombina TaxID=8345 RepID=UPI00235B0463|nr:V-set and immunoglobulin domain-containing protein 2 [Bombina bombina]
MYVQNTKQAKFFQTVTRKLIKIQKGSLIVAGDLNVALEPDLDCSLGQDVLLFLDAVQSVEVTIPEAAVVGKTGSTVTLPCLYKTSVGSHFVLEWRFATGSTQTSSGSQIYYYTNGNSYKPGSQYDRLSISQNPPTTGIASIQLSNIRSSDSGSYVCEVSNPPDFSGTGSGMIKLTVLVPPSTPNCQLNGKTIAGRDVTLTCNSSGVPPPIYKWSFVGSKVPLLPSMMENQITGNLLLTNLSQAISGTYQCVASNEMGNANCEITITVTTMALLYEDPNKQLSAESAMRTLKHPVEDYIAEFKHWSEETL